MGMNKGKLKRVKRDLERLFNQGRYWDFLKGVEAEAADDLLPKESERAWRGLVREAFDSADNMLGFFARAGEIRAVPDTPDIRFLFLLKRFVNGESVAAEAEAAGNLSPIASLMKKRLLIWNDGLVDTKRVERLFDLFLAKPDKVTKKDFTELPDHIPDGYGTLYDSLSDSFETLRRFNLKGAVNRKRKGMDLGRIAEIDNELKDMDDVSPPGIFRIILTPFLYQVSLLYGNYARDDHGFALEMCGAMPFLTRKLTGERWRELEGFLMESDLDALYGEDRRFVRKKMASAAFPEKVRLLQNLAAYLTRLENDTDDPFYDFDEAPDDTQAFEDYLLLYRDILAEIGRTKETLSPRDQRELEQVMAGVLERDFDRFTRTPNDCLAFLRAVVQSGCLNTRLALTALFISRYAGERSLRESTEKALRALPFPVKEDMKWFFDHFSFLCYPAVSNLYPLINYIKDDRALTDLVIDLLGIKVTGNLVENYMKINMGGTIFSFMTDGFSRKESRQEMTRFKKELLNFKEIAGFERLFELAEAYPEGYITETGYKKMAAGKYANEGIEEVIALLADIPAHNKNTPGFDPFVAEEMGFDEFTTLQTNAVMEVIREHFADLRTVRLESINSLVDSLQAHTITPERAQFLVRLNNMLQERQLSGEAEAKPLINRLSDMTIRASKPGKIGGRRR